jgi:hypothetical protein
VCVERVEAIAWKATSSGDSPFALVQEAEEKKNDAKDDDYVEVIAPTVTLSADIIRGRGTWGCRRG